MARYIDADKLIKFFPDDEEGNWTYNVTAQSYINIQPTADVVPSRFGCGSAPYCSYVFEVDEDE